MENRFGLKDLFLFVLMIAVIIMIVLAMKQYDRQWPVLKAIQSSSDNQTRDLATIRRLMERAQRSGGGIFSGRPTTAPSGFVNDPFRRIEAAEAQPDYAQGDWLISSFPVNVGKLTPLVSTDLYSDDVQSYVLESLAQRDPTTLEWQPMLAESFHTSEDGLSIRFKVRRDVVFSDGAPLTVDDIIFTYHLIMNHELEDPRWWAYYDKIAKVEKTGDWEVTFYFKEPYFDSFGLAGGMSILPKHFYEKYTPAQINRETGLLMGTGPYRLPDPTSWKPGTQIYLTRNERYWGEPPAFDRLVFREINNDTARMTLFRNGELDVFGASPKQYKDLLKDAELVKRTQHFEYINPTSGYNFIAWNQRKKDQPTRFDSQKVRQAMTLLTDRQRIANEVMLGYATVATGPFSPASPQNDPAIEPWPYDPAKARALLKEAGYADDGTGVLKNAAGDSFRFTLTYPTGNESTDRIVKFLKDDYARAGIIMDAEPLDWSIFADRLKHHDFDAITLGWGGSIEDDIYQMFHSSQIADQGDNFISYSNPALDKKIVEARSTVDEKKRMPLWHQCQKILHEDQPYTFLTNRKSLVFINGRIKNVHITKVGLNPPIQVEWYVPADQQKYH